jgi:hypothetical protein
VVKQKCLFFCDRTAPLFKEKEMKDEVYTIAIRTMKACCRQTGIASQYKVNQGPVARIKTTSNKEPENQQQFFLPSPP